MPDGYKPATVQEALLHVYMGERAVSELLQQVAALHRRGAPVPGPSAHPPPAAPSAITTLGFHLTRPALHSRRSLHQRVADPRAPVQAPALPVLTPPAFDIAQRASPPPVAPHADTSSTVRAAPGLSGLTAEIPRVVFDDAEVSQTFSDVASQLACTCPTWLNWLVLGSTAMMVAGKFKGSAPTTVPSDVVIVGLGCLTVYHMNPHDWERLGEKTGGTELESSQLEHWQRLYDMLQLLICTIPPAGWLDCAFNCVVRTTAAAWINW
ncbi:unnamed protein product [Symbiodinium microadriaticum]|nr:unnamed protein product [Symbiodinium microadriaticum]